MLKVERTWDGRPAPDAEHVTMDLSLGTRALTVHVDAPFHGDSAPKAPAGSLPGLWDYEVVELFVLGSGEQYLEVELGPHGHFWVLQFDGPRQGTRSGLSIAYHAHIDGSRWRAEAVIPTNLLPPGVRAGNAYAIHGTEPTRRYLALHPVPGDGPDFHRLDCFSDLPGLV